MKLHSKVSSTFRIVVTLFFARLLGEYQHSFWDGNCDYAVYRWRGQCWAIPLTSWEPHQ